VSVAPDCLVFPFDASTFVRIVFFPAVFEDLLVLGVAVVTSLPVPPWPNMAGEHKSRKLTIIKVGQVRWFLIGILVEYWSSHKTAMANRVLI
jgi:hypothetical protein